MDLLIYWLPAQGVSVILLTRAAITQDTGSLEIIHQTCKYSGCLCHKTLAKKKGNKMENYGYYNIYCIKSLRQPKQFW